MGGTQSTKYAETKSGTIKRLFKKDDCKDTDSVLHGLHSNSDAYSDPNFAWVGQRTFNMNNTPGCSRYPLPNDEEEMDRLNQQHYLIRTVFDTNYEPHIEEVLQSGSRVLDVGCGSATWLLEMATEFPEVEFYGIDISPIFPREIKPPNTHFSIVDVVQGLPFPDDYFSFAQQRMFMPALRTSEWPSVMADIFRVVKPGGWIQLLEADPNIHNVPEEKMDFWNKFLEYRASVNEDHSTFRRLAKHLKRAGFQSVQRRYMSVPVGWNGPIGDLMRDVYLGYLLAYMPRSAAGMGLTEAEFERLTREYISCCTEVEAYLNFHVLTGQKPEVEEANARA